jgi:hypothetical protein
MKVGTSVVLPVTHAKASVLLAQAHRLTIIARNVIMPSVHLSLTWLTNVQMTVPLKELTGMMPVIPRILSVLRVMRVAQLVLQAQRQPAVDVLQDSISTLQLAVLARTTAVSAQDLL